MVGMVSYVFSSAAGTHPPTHLCSRNSAYASSIVELVAGYLLLMKELLQRHGQQVTITPTLVEPGPSNIRTEIVPWTKSPKKYAPWYSEGKVFPRYLMLH